MKAGSHEATQAAVPPPESDGAASQVAVASQRLVLKSAPQTQQMC